ncbi:MAG: PadR family transcriptional regulator [Candidatus Bathyarchaeia archaeon]|nr:PadR family transcriptional regulator [Candidatus Bathyarchaeia archaeon]
MKELGKDLVKATVRGFSRVIILWLISQKPMSGYGIVKELKRLTGQKFHSGVVYPLLYELEENKLIAGEWMQRGRRCVKQYSITKEGRELLNFMRELFEMPVKEILKDFITSYE